MPFSFFHCAIQTTSCGFNLEYFELDSPHASGIVMRLKMTFVTIDFHYFFDLFIAH